MCSEAELTGKKDNNMKRKNKIIMTSLLLLTVSISVSAQARIGGTDSPRTDIVLDLNATDAVNNGAKALALPRVALTSTQLPAPLTDFVEGMFVYNTATAGDVTPGNYYSDGASWIRVGAEAYPSAPPVPIDSCGGTNKLSEATATILSKEYYIATFGTAGCWMTENLREVPKGSDGADVVRSRANAYDKQYYSWPSAIAKGDGLDTTSTKYGYLYNWAAAMDIKGDTRLAPWNVDMGYGTPNANDWQKWQGICPSGWHLPSDYEWSVLEQEIAEDELQKYSTNTEGVSYGTAVEYNSTGMRYTTQNAAGLSRKLRPTMRIWSGNYPMGDSKSPTEGGFYALPAGSLYMSEANSSLGVSAYWWSSSSSTDVYGYTRVLGVAISYGVSRYDSRTKTYFMSVRCKKN
jgi:uncharacterized protein (TIGR02145 family)